MLSVPSTKRPTPLKEIFQIFDSDMVSEWVRMGGPAAFTQMVYQFTQDVMKCLQDLDRALIHNDPTSFAHTAHGLKGICQHMGAKRWASLLEHMEEESVQHFPSHHSFHVSRFRDEFSSFVSSAGMFERPTFISQQGQTTSSIIKFY